MLIYSSFILLLLLLIIIVIVLKKKHKSKKNTVAQRATRHKSKKNQEKSKNKINKNFKTYLLRYNNPSLPLYDNPKSTDIYLYYKPLHWREAFYLWINELGGIPNIPINEYNYLKMTPIDLNDDYNNYGYYDYQFYGTNYHTKNILSKMQPFDKDSEYNGKTVQQLLSKNKNNFSVIERPGNDGYYNVWAPLITDYNNRIIKDFSNITNFYKNSTNKQKKQLWKTVAETIENMNKTKLCIGTHGLQISWLHIRIRDSVNNDYECLN
jgi:hypothetical protein